MSITNKVINGCNKAKFNLKKHSPEILIISGVIGTVTSCVMACKATTKVSKIIDESKETVAKIHEVENDESLSEDYSKDDVKKDLTITYVQTGIKIAKLYAPSFILGTVSIASIIFSNRILKKRNAALAAAYATLDAGFKNYRKSVIEKYGSEIDKQLRFGSVKEKIGETITDENGKTKVAKKDVNISNPEYSDYAVWFDKGSSKYYEGVMDYDIMFLHAQENYANDMLKAKGYLTLNDVFDNLGCSNVPERLRKAGMVVGWKYEKDNPVGDNRVIFDIHETYRKYDDGTVEPCILLDFNVEGNIYDRM